MPADPGQGSWAKGRDAACNDNCTLTSSWRWHLWRWHLCRISTHSRCWKQLQFLGSVRATDLLLAVALAQVVGAGCRANEGDEVPPVAAKGRCDAEHQRRTAQACTQEDPSMINAEYHQLTPNQSCRQRRHNAEHQCALPRPALQQHSVTATVPDVGCETLKWRNAEHRSRAAQACSTAAGYHWQCATN